MADKKKTTKKMEEKGAKGSFKEYCNRQGCTKTAKQSKDEKLKKKKEDK